MKSTEKHAQTPTELLHEMEGLVGEAQAMITNAATEYSEDALSALRSRFEAAQERLTGLYTDARRKVVAGAKCADGAIREHPYQSLAIALGAGVLLGVLLGRRCK